MRSFLDGARDIDNVFLNEQDISKNLPLALGLLGFYNNYICDY